VAANALNQDDKMGLTVDLSRIKAIQAKIDSFGSVEAVNTDKMLRGIASTMCADIVERIHEKGEKADSSQIGTYSASYMKQRKKKGYSGSKVVLSYERQMQNDFGIGAVDPIKINGVGYGLGFKNSFNADKAQWMEDRYGDIYKLQKREKEKVIALANDFIDDTFKGRV
jgi:hypothetical protein